MALSSVAFICLIVSGLALNQILPGYFAEQAERRLESARTSTMLVMLNDIEQAPMEVLQVSERRQRLLGRLARIAADNLALARVEILQVLDGAQVALAEPGDTERLLEQGLRPDPQVDPTEFVLELDIGLPQPPATLEDDTVVPLLVRISEPYTSREASLEQVRGALVAAGLVALAVSLVVGIVAARRLVVPLRRLERASHRLAAGELDERVPNSGVTEIDELGAQFNDMADRLRETLTMLEADRDRLREFVADVSHELRTPIAALRTFVDLQREGELDDDTRREFLQRSSEQIRRLEWLSTNLLDLSRIDAGLFPLDIRQGDLRDAVRAVVESHAEAAEARSISLVSEVPRAAVTLAFDWERIVQLVNNLVGNALKFTPPGGDVAVTIADDAEEVVLEVRDTGPGVEPDELPHIFDRFYRGTNVGEARASGSGLGLAIARSIAEMHGGSIEVESVAGEGATFRLRLPRQAEIPASGTRAEHRLERPAQLAGVAGRPHARGAVRHGDALPEDQ
jgi:signal transduction histidine kinase